MRTWRSVALAGFIALATTGAALGLDAADILNMVENGVDEGVIISVVGNRRLAHYPTVQEIVSLHQAGASPELLAFLTSGQAVEIVSSAPAVVVSDPLPCSPCAKPAPIVVEQPPVVVYEPAPVVVPNYVYDPWPQRYHPNFYWEWDHWYRRPPRYHGRPHRPPPPRHIGRPGGTARTEAWRQAGRTTRAA